jgi:hypothetical protein
MVLLGFLTVSDRLGPKWAGRPVWPSLDGIGEAIGGSQEIVSLLPLEYVYALLR